MTDYAKKIIADVRKQQYPNLRGLDEVKKLMIDDVEVPLECYPSNIPQWSYNYISKTFNNLYGETAVDHLINLRMKINWSFENADEATVKFWMGLINSRVLGVRNRMFKVNLKMPGFGYIESIWHTGAPITGSAVKGSGHDGIVGAPGSSYYTSGDLLPGDTVKVFDYTTGEVIDDRYYGSDASDSNVTDFTAGVPDYSNFEIHWIEKKGIRLNKITDINLSDIVQGDSTI